mmetsp:Transcript_83134/g.238849  ORF Transcript_83134/g.238849 Transcript_83134/m.238849 type:complete len:215 (-) Transcript_83134:592-1236(-)
MQTGLLFCIDSCRLCCGPLCVFGLVLGINVKQAVFVRLDKAHELKVLLAVLLSINALPAIGRIKHDGEDADDAIQLPRRRRYRHHGPQVHPLDPKDEPAVPLDLNSWVIQVVHLLHHHCGVVRATGGVIVVGRLQKHEAIPGLRRRRLRGAGDVVARGQHRLSLAELHEHVAEQLGLLDGGAVLLAEGNRLSSPLRNRRIERRLGISLHRRQTV